MNKKGDNEKIYAIIPAAGAGLRMGDGVAKQFRLLEGKPVLLHAIEAVVGNKRISGAVVVVPSTDVEAVAKILDESDIKKVIKVIAGGVTRSDSVAEGIKVLPADSTYVLIHDGVRPFVGQRLIDEVIDAAMESQAATAAIPVSDTLKSVSGTKITGSISRKDVWRIQTPQCFNLKILQEGLHKAKQDGFIATDESSLVERINKEVKVVAGDETNIKITTPADMKLAEAIAAQKLDFSQ